VLAVALRVIDHEVAKAFIDEPESRLVLTHPLLSPPHRWSSVDARAGADTIVFARQRAPDSELPCLDPANRGYVHYVDSANEKRGTRAVLVRTLEIAATAEAPTLARRWLDDISSLRVLGQVAFDVRLLVTELVGNSVRHAGLDESDLITVMLELSGACVRVEVRDPGEGFAFPVRPQKLDIEGGRGLQIVAAIAHRWGIERSEPIAVWFEIDLERATAVGTRLSRECACGLVL
jgi:anti-sigma regulatory factor (Ser/Thr protein kinase)